MGGDREIVTNGDMVRRGVQKLASFLNSPKLTLQDLNNADF